MHHSKDVQILHMTMTTFYSVDIFIFFGILLFHTGMLPQYLWTGSASQHKKNEWGMWVMGQYILKSEIRLIILHLLSNSLWWFRVNQSRNNLDAVKIRFVLCDSSLLCFYLFLKHFSFLLLFSFFHCNSRDTEICKNFPVNWICSPLSGRLTGLHGLTVCFSLVQAWMWRIAYFEKYISNFPDHLPLCKKAASVPQSKKPRCVLMRSNFCLL